VVESQIYSRLTENPDGYAADGWPGEFSLRGAREALAARGRGRSWSGRTARSSGPM
jgi:hypothetical protein